MKAALKNAVPEILSRVTIASVFVGSGWGKLQNLPKVVEYFESLHIPLASVQAPFVAGVELVAGTLILIGLFTRVASLPLIATMVVALITAKSDDITGFTSLFDLSEFLYIVILTWLAAHGARYLSVDRYWRGSKG